MRCVIGFTINKDIYNVRKKFSKSDAPTLQVVKPAESENLDSAEENYALGLKNFY